MKKVVAFTKSPITEPSNLLNQGNGQLFPKDQLPRNWTLGMVPARRRCIHHSKRDKKWTACSHKQPNFQQRNKPKEPLRTWRRFQHHATLTHHKMGAGGVAEICKLNSMVWRLPWDRLMVAFFNPLPLEFPRNATQHTITPATPAGLGTRTARSPWYL